MAQSKIDWSEAILLDKTTINTPGMPDDLAILTIHNEEV
jgi:hypothetical protein